MSRSSDLRLGELAGCGRRGDVLGSRTVRENYRVFVAIQDIWIGLSATSGVTRMRRVPRLRADVASAPTQTGLHSQGLLDFGGDGGAESLHL